MHVPLQAVALNYRVSGQRLGTGAAVGLSRLYLGPTVLAEHRRLLLAQPPNLNLFFLFFVRRGRPQGSPEGNLRATKFRLRFADETRFHPQPAAFIVGKSAGE